MRLPLSPPDEELARRILKSVSYKDRIPAGRFSPRLGIMRGSVRGLPELHLYLTPDVSVLPAINLERLATWIEQAIVDPELARAVRLAVTDAGSYVAGCMNVHELVGSRVMQAREVAGPNCGDTLERKEV